MRKWLHSNKGSSQVLGGIHNAFAMLFIGYTFKENDVLKQGHVAFSGFLCHHKGPPCWISAGHIHEQWAKIKTYGTIRTITFLDAAMDGVEPQFNGIPMTEADFNFIHIDRNGLDVGVMVFRKRLWELIIQNPKNISLKSTNWRSRERTDAYYLIGAPIETAKKSEGFTKASYTLSLMSKIECLPLKKIKDRKRRLPLDFWNRRGAFYGKILPFTDGVKQPDDIAFMSGGPIIRVKFNPKTCIVSARLVGIQSSWQKETRIIRATHARDLEAVMALIHKESKRLNRMQVKNARRNTNDKQPSVSRR